MIRFLKSTDWVLIVALIPILLGGIITMSSLGGDSSFAFKQIIWIIVSIIIFFAVSLIDIQFFKKTRTLIWLYIFGISLLVATLVFGSTIKGATSWISFGSFSLQVADPMKLILILILAKYLSRRHIEIANPKHIAITLAYMVLPLGLILLQPDFGSGMIFGAIWLGMMLISGISRKHLMIFFITGVILFTLAWFFGFKPYQKARILTFINPTSDIQGSGYNVYQSMIAVGSGKILGKGVGYGTQSRLNFLPEYRTDFIFAAFAEEWGFIGSIIILICFLIVFWRILLIVLYGMSNFEILFASGFLIFLVSHTVINIGMNIGIMPVTGITLPFMSYGGSHLLTEFIGLGILMSMRKYNRTTHRDDMKHEFLGTTY